MTSPDLNKTFYNPDAETITILEPGMSLAGRYKLIKQIGRGGMGVIWSAEERAAGRKVVLKFVPNELKNFESAVAQLKESFQKIHGLQHQHICPVYTLEEEFSFGYYLVMKWLEGETLDEYIVRTIGRQQPLPFEDVLRILRPVAEALDYAHGQRIIHRDIKPSNIFVVLNEQKSIRDLQVIDFGLASEIRSSLSRVSQVQFDNSGTRPYMAPEQWRGRLQSAATDQYSLAVVAYEMLSGYVPFDGDDVQMLGNAILNFPPEPIREMSEQVNAALLKALAKDGSGRFESCAQFIAALGGAAIPVVQAASSIEAEAEKIYLRMKAEKEAEASRVKADRIARERFEQEEQTHKLEAERLRFCQPGSVAGKREVLMVKGVEYAFRWCPPGTFTMGSPVGQEIVEKKGILWDTKKLVGGEPDRSPDEVPHQVTLSRGFWMLETQVTQEMWESVMGSNPSHFKGDKRLPVENVSWDDCQEFIARLNALFSPVSEKRAVRFSLPTEAQWEYACRADTTTPFHFGSVLNGDKANCNGDYPYGTETKGRYLAKTSVVGSYPANAWGLCDMHGNVWEWCSDDWYGDYPSGAVMTLRGRLRAAAIA